MKSVYLFAGDWRGPAPGEPFYDGLTPATNECLYAVHPLNPQHLGWSESLDNRLFAVNSILAAGANAVNMSYWGPPGDNAWSWWAPMQTAIGSHDQLFDVAVGRPLLIIPTIEDYAANTSAPPQGNCPQDPPGLGPVGNSAGYHFADDFPGTQQNPAPGLVLRIEDLINRYLRSGNPDRSAKWAQLYDKDGVPRYAITIIQVGSNQTTSDADFAAGFDWVANKVWQDTGGSNGGVRIGFTLDALPGYYSQMIASFFPLAARTGPEFIKHASILAIQAFAPEVWTGICDVMINPGANCDQVAGSSALDALINFKQGYIQGWVNSGVPVILDVDPGYDGIGPGSSRFWGNNDPWRNAQAGFLSLGVVGLVGNTWNGFTEGYALMPACGLPPGLLCSPFNVSPVDVNSTWFREMVAPGGTAARIPVAITNVGPAGSGLFSHIITLTATLTEALRDGPSGTTIGGSALAGRTVHFTVGSQRVDGVTLSNGTAVATMTLNQQPATVDRVVSFDGDDGLSSLFVKDKFVILHDETAIAFTASSARAADYDDAAIVQVQLTTDGAPLANEPVTISLGSGVGTETCVAPMTAASGLATCQITPNQQAGPYMITATFAGDSSYLASSASAPFTINKEETVTRFTMSSPTVIANGHATTFSATLLEDGITPIRGRTITITVGSQSCPTGPTDPTGMASCTIVLSQVPGPSTVKASFAGDVFYLPSSTSEPVIVFSFLNSGSMVIGNLNAAPGVAVEFWGAQWAKNNSLSTGSAPDAFEGFASTAPQSCGPGWTSSPGNSASPPATVPSYMGVIASSSIMQSGSIIAGDVPIIVVVKTNLGYGPSPGHAGTGTVVATFCP